MTTASGRKQPLTTPKSDSIIYIYRFVKTFLKKVFGGIFVAFVLAFGIYEGVGFITYIYMMKKDLGLKIEQYTNAVTTLVEAIEGFDGDLVKRDGILQRFEYCLESAWKTLKLVLEQESVEFMPSPKQVVKHAGKI